MIEAIFVIAIIFVGFVIFSGLKDNESISENESKDFSQHLVRKEFFMSENEKAFFDMFDRYLKGRKYRLFSKVSLAHIVETKDFYTPKGKILFEKMKKISVDFVIIDAQGSIVRAIDFFDEHEKISIDEPIKQKIFLHLGIGYSKVKASERYNFNEILQK